MARWTKTVAERFADKVKVMPSGCHEWTGALGGSFGYGVFMVRTGRQERAHRYAWEQANGPLAEGECVLHRCDNPKCVRVDHLFLGDRADNIRDASVKLRLGRSKNKEFQALVIEAFAMREAGATYVEVAAKLGLPKLAAWEVFNKRGYMRGLVGEQKPNRVRCTMTDDEVEAAKEMRDGGATWQSTADAMGVDITTLFNRIPDRKGHKLKITAEQLDAVRAAVAQGETIKAACGRLDLTYTSVVFALKSRKGAAQPTRNGFGGWRPGSGRKPRKGPP
jgi:hypothetical protein